MTDETNAQKAHTTQGGENMQNPHKSPKIDTSAQAVEEMIRFHLLDQDDVSPTGEVLRALVAERDALKAKVDEHKACAKARHDHLAQDQEVIADLKLEADRLRVELHKRASISPKCVAVPQAELDATSGIIAERDDLQTEVERLREELGQHDGDLDQRMAALGMIPMSQLLSQPPTPFSVHAAMNSIEFFAEWVERKHATYLKMRMRYETGKRPKDDDGMFEWVFAHGATFGEVHDNLRAALKGGA